MQADGDDGNLSVNPRHSVLLRGLDDWVALDRIHWDVAQSMPGVPVSRIQDAVLSLLRELLRENLFEIGEVTTERGFVRWTKPIDQVIDRVHRCYVVGFSDADRWPWCCWLNLTEQGNHVAHQLQQQNTLDDGTSREGTDDEREL
jgi:hypothetical protein